MHNVLPELLIVVAIIVAFCGPGLTMLLARRVMTMIKHYRQSLAHRRIGG